jgi:hypothetical protein
LIPYARNARKIPQEAIDKVAASIKEFGWRQPIVVDSDRVVVAGHVRLLAAKQLGLERRWRNGLKSATYCPNCRSICLARNRPSVYRPARYPRCMVRRLFASDEQPNLQRAKNDYCVLNG